MASKKQSGSKKTSTKKKTAAKKEPSSREYLATAKRHLEKVQESWEEPDWSDLAMYGLYCLEAAILAAATHLGWTSKKTHWDKAELAERLHKEQGLPDVTELLPLLNDGRKAMAYGDVDFDFSDLDAQDVATEIETFVDSVEALLEDDDAQ